MSFVNHVAMSFNRMNLDPSLRPVTTATWGCGTTPVDVTALSRLNLFMAAQIRYLEHDDIVRELKRVREHGLSATRRLSLPNLQEATVRSGIGVAGNINPAAIEELIRKAVPHLGGGTHQEAAAVTFGLLPGTKLTKGTDRRRQASRLLGVAPETFRRKHEGELIDEVAEGVLALCHNQAMRIAHFNMEQRHPADTRLAVAWVERFEYYFRIWTPVYALKADLEAALATYNMEPADHLPWDPDSVRAFDPVEQAQSYGRSALFWYVSYLLAVKRFIDERGGMWLFSDPQVEDFVTDAVFRIGWHNPINEENDSWLRRKLADSRHQEAEHFYRTLEASSVGEDILGVWQKFVRDGHDAEARGDTSASQVHSTVVACEDYRSAIDNDWLKIADWYAPGSKAPRGLDGKDLFAQHLKAVKTSRNKNKS